MERNSKAKVYSKKIFLYLKKNIIITGFVGYYFIGFILYLFADIDVLLPCIYYSIFNVKCPGCGLTSAFIHLFSFEFHEAWETNSLVYVVFPGIVYYTIKDFINFLKNNKD